jgi:Transposase IS66 family
VHRIVQALAADGFDVASGTLVGALKQIAPLIAPWAEAIAAHGRQAGHVHADETSWQVFEDVGGKDGHRWWLWVFVTDQATVFVMDTSRSAEVAAGQLGIDREQAALEAGRRLVISSDFHKAYQSLARIDGVDPLWCWAHMRRYFLRAGAAHLEAPGDWAMRGPSGLRCCTGRTTRWPPPHPAPMPARMPPAAGSGPSPTSTRTACSRPTTPERACCTRPPPRSSPP